MVDRGLSLQGNSPFSVKRLGSDAQSRLLGISLAWYGKVP